jgi:hypothetical protein
MRASKIRINRTYRVEIDIQFVVDGIFVNYVKLRLRVYRSVTLVQK